MSNFKYGILLTRFLVAHRRLFYGENNPERLEKCELVWKKWMLWRKRNNRAT
jgi:hypothetical protein